MKINKCLKPTKKETRSSQNPAAIKKLYEGFNPPPINEEPALENKEYPKPIVDENGNIQSFIDVNISNIKETEDGRVEVTVRADAIIRIKEGDNLTDLAKNHNTTVEQLVEWNDIEDPNLIIAGRYLKVGEGSETQVFDKEDDSVVIESNPDN